MTPNEQRRYAQEAKQFRNRLESGAERIARRFLSALLDRVKGQLGISDANPLGSLWPAEDNADVDALFTETHAKAMIAAIYNEVGPKAALHEFETVRARIVKQVGQKRKHPFFDIAFFSRKWQALMMSLMGNDETAARVTKITEKQRSMIRAALKEAYENRLDVRATAGLIEERLGGKILKQRALMIARTETTRAASVGAEMGAAETQIKLQKVWIATADNRTRPAHYAMLGKPPVDKDEKFNVGGVLMKYPGDPAGGAANCVNCRCVVSYVPVMVNGLPVPAQRGTQAATGAIGRVLAAVTRSSFAMAIADLFR